MIRPIIILNILIISFFPVHGQEAEGVLYQNNLQQLHINESVSLHFVSPEPIQYVDISTDNLVGDIPIENVFRIKLTGKYVSEGKGGNQPLGVVTIIGQKYIAQYALHYAPTSKDIETQVEILPKDMNPLEVGATPLSQNELQEFCLQAYKRKKRNYDITNTQNGISGEVNNIYALDDYIFLDITYTNRTNLKFDIDQVRFKIEDKKAIKATNIQSIEVEPEYQLFDKTSFKRRHRNIYVLKKFTFPNNKVLSIELTETQISGRTLFLQIDYSDLLSADTL